MRREPRASRPRGAARPWLAQARPRARRYFPPPDGVPWQRVVGAGRPRQESQGRLSTTSEAGTRLALPVHGGRRCTRRTPHRTRCRPLETIMDAASRHRPALDGLAGLLAGLNVLAAVGYAG